MSVNTEIRLIEIIKQYVLEFSSGILPRSIPFIIISRETEYFISPTGNHVISVCNHEDADTHLVLHASKLILMLLLFVKIHCPCFNDLGIFKVADIRKILSRQNIVFEFTENTRLNTMRYPILFLSSREN